MTWKDLKLIVNEMSEEQLNREVVYLEGHDDKLIMPVDLE